MEFLWSYSNWNFWTFRESGAHLFPKFKCEYLVHMKLWVWEVSNMLVNCSTPQEYLEHLFLQFWSGQYLENKTELCWPLLVIFGQSFANPPSPKVVNWLKRNRSWNSTTVHKTCFQIRFYCTHSGLAKRFWSVFQGHCEKFCQVQ